MKLLHIDSSILGQNSASRELGAAVVARWQAERPGLEVAYRDLAADPAPHLGAGSLAGSDPAEAALATAMMDEFLAADVVVVGAPMYNFGIPSQLKAWIDRIVIAGATFRYTEDGPEGLAKGKRVIIALARGGFYDGGSPAAGLEHLESYLRGIFNFIGIEPEFVAADGLNFRPEQREASIRAALGETIRLAA